MEEEPREQEITLQSEAVTINQGGGAVNSVNGQTGDVVLTTSDLENTSDYQTGSEVESAISTAVANEASARESADASLQGAISAETTAREAADTNLQSQIDGITASSDVTDIVGTYAQLQAYDTSTLGDNDIIKVLQDESRNDETTYYRWSTATQSFTLIGEEGPYYTKSQTDTLLNAKQNTLTAGTGIDITGDVISATGGSGPTVVQTTGTSTTDVMSQNATTSMVFADPDQQTKVKIGASAISNSNNSIAIGSGAKADSSSSFRSSVIGNNARSEKQDAVALGAYASTNSSGDFGVAIGRSANCSKKGAIALGAYSGVSYTGEFNIGSSDSSCGYNNTNYRLLTGVHDPVDDHDAATKGYVDTAVAGGGGGVTPVQTIGTSTTDVMSQKATTDMIYSDKTTSSYNSGGAVYIGCLNANQERMPDPTTIDLMDKYFWALPGLANSVPSSKSVNIMGMQAANYSVAIGQDANIPSIGQYGVAVGYGATSRGNGSVAIGRSSYVNNNINHSVALGENASPTRNGEVNIGTGSQSVGYNSTSYRVIGGVHDGQLAQDAVTVNQVNSVIDAINTALSTSIPHIGA